MPDAAWEGLNLASVFVATLIYLVFDTYPIAKSFRATFQTPSFYLLWLIVSILNLIAYGILRISAQAKIQAAVGPTLAPLTLVLLATLGTVGILQSLTLKLADFKFIDVGKLIDGYKAVVLEDINDAIERGRRSEVLAAAEALSKNYDENELKTEYSALMAYMGMQAAQINDRISQMEHDNAAAGTLLARALAEGIAKADPGSAELLLAKASRRHG